MTDDVKTTRKKHQLGTHILMVQTDMHTVLQNLTGRSDLHDYSKRQNINESPQEHYLKNDHHIRHHLDISKMSLAALLEMLADWHITAYTEEVPMKEYMQLKREGHKIPDALFSILEATITEYGWWERGS